MTDTAGFTQRARRPIADLGFLSITMRDVVTPSGEGIERIVIEHPGAAAVVPLVDGDVILVAQYRTAVDSVVLEIPAGKVDDQSHDRPSTAMRELEEETGYRAGRLEHLTDIMTSVGFCDEVISLYVATDLGPGTRAPVGAEEETARIVRMPLSEAVQAVLHGEITDAKTAIGLLIVGSRGSS